MISGFVQVCHWSGRCLYPEEAEEFRFQFQAFTTSSDADDAPAASPGHLSDVSQLIIMLSVGILLIIVAAICVWLVLRKRSASQRAAPVIPPNSVGGGSGRGHVCPSSLHRSRSGMSSAKPPRSMSAKPGRYPAGFKPSSRQNSSSASSEEHVVSELASVRMDATGCPMSV